MENLGGAARLPEEQELSLPLLALMGCCCGLQLTISGALETLLVQDLGLDHGLTGLSQAVFFTGNLLGSLLAGEFIFRAKPRAVGSIALGLMSVGALIAAWPTFPTLIIGRFVAGLGLSTTVVFVSALVVGRYPDKQGPLLNAFHACVALGAALALGISRPLADATGSGPLAMAIPGALAAQIALYLSLWPVLPAAGDHTVPPGLASWLPLLRSRPFRAVLLLMAGYMVAEQGASLFGAALIEGEGQFSAGLAGITAALLWVGVAVGRLTAALFLPKLSERSVLLACMGMGIVALIMTTTLSGRHGHLTAICLLMGGVLLGPVIPLCFSQAARLAGAARGPAMGLANAVGCLGGAAGPMIIGFSADASGLGFGMASGYLVALASTAPLLWLTLMPSDRSA